MGGFYPSLFYNVMMNKVSSRNWFDRVDDHIIVGALPFKGDIEKLTKQENVKAVVSLCQGYEHKKFVAGKEDWEKLGVDYLNLPTIDYSSPSTDDIETGIDFIQKHADQDETVYVHCKAGRTRSATLVGCYLIHKKRWTPSNSKSYLEQKRPHVVLQDLHFRAMYRFYDKLVKPKHKKPGKGGSHEDLESAEVGETSERKEGDGEEEGEEKAAGGENGAVVAEGAEGDAAGEKEGSDRVADKGSDRGADEGSDRGADEGSDRGADEVEERREVDEEKEDDK